MAEEINDKLEQNIRKLIHDFEFDHSVKVTLINYQYSKVADQYIKANPKENLIDRTVNDVLVIFEK